MKSSELTWKESDYLNNLIEKCERIDAFPILADPFFDERPLRLSDVYTPLGLEPKRHLPTITAASTETDNPNMEPDFDFLIYLSDFGGGKTSLLNMQCMLQAKRLLRKSSSNDYEDYQKKAADAVIPEDWFPVLLRLRDIEVSCCDADSSPDAIAKLLIDSLGNSVYAAHDDLVLFIDGLDECADAGMVKIFLKSLFAYMNSSQKIRKAIATSDSYYYANNNLRAFIVAESMNCECSSSFGEYDIKSVDWEDTYKSFFSKWDSALGNTDEHASISKMVAIFNNKELLGRYFLTSSSEIAPFYLASTILYASYRNGLPENQVEFAQFLLELSLTRDSSLEERQQRSIIRLLSQIAYSVSTNTEDHRTITLQELQSLIQQIRKESNPQYEHILDDVKSDVELIDYLTKRSVLTKMGSFVFFSNGLIQAYLTANCVNYLLFSGDEIDKSKIDYIKEFILNTSSTTDDDLQMRTLVAQFLCQMDKKLGAKISETLINELYPAGDLRIKTKKYCSDLLAIFFSIHKNSLRIDTVRLESIYDLLTDQPLLDHLFGERLGANGHVHALQSFLSHSQRNSDLFIQVILRKFKGRPIQQFGMELDENAIPDILSNCIFDCICHYEIDKKLMEDAFNSFFANGFTLGMMESLNLLNNKPFSEQAYYYLKDTLAHDIEQGNYPRFCSIFALQDSFLYDCFDDAPFVPWDDILNLILENTEKSKVHAITLLKIYLQIVTGDEDYNPEDLDNVDDSNILSFAEFLDSGMKYSKNEQLRQDYEYVFHHLFEYIPDSKDWEDYDDVVEWYCREYPDTFEN